MQIKEITLQTLVEKLQKLIGKPIWRVIHPSGGWLFFDIGRKYQDTISGIDGEEKPYTKGEFQLFIKGDWTVTSSNGHIVESRMVGQDEEQLAYFDRLEKLAADFPIKVFEDIAPDKSEIVFAGGEYALRVKADGKFDAIGVTQVKLDEDNKPISFSHFRFDEEINSLVSVET